LLYYTGRIWLLKAIHGIYNLWTVTMLVDDVPKSFMSNGQGLPFPSVFVFYGSDIISARIISSF